MFPEYRDLITQLKTTDRHFLRLFDQHNELDQRIKNMEASISPATHEEIETLEGLAKFKTATWRKHFGAQYLSTLRLSGRMRSAIASIPPWVTRSAPSQGVANRFRS